ncbi:NAD-dependent epimerase/dehydratase family protein [Streptomyces sp. NPDC056534]|uniref:NAD-dependent epimerase/dehydratase family protein n=1 Tax=Streptomyces sp. NPDC056534 TaxID=3345857 RepID=UPI0036C52F97
MRPGDAAHRVGIMRILVLGGTSFIGRAIAERALAEGAEVTLFTRGLTNPDLFPQAARLVGDRASGSYGALASGSGWDAAVDVSGYVPRHVRQAADAVSGRTGRYLFISTVAVYDFSGDDGSTAVWNENSPRVKPVRSEEITSVTYGGIVRLSGGLLRWHGHLSGRGRWRGCSWTRRRTGVSASRGRSSAIACGCTTGSI